MDHDHRGPKGRFHKWESVIISDLSQPESHKQGFSWGFYGGSPRSFALLLKMPQWSSCESRVQGCMKPLDVEKGSLDGPHRLQICPGIGGVDLDGFGHDFASILHFWCPELSTYVQRPSRSMDSRECQYNGDVHASVQVKSWIWSSLEEESASSLLVLWALQLVF